MKNLTTSATVTGAPVIVEHQGEQNRKDTQREGGVGPVVERPGKRFAIQPASGPLDEFGH